MPLRTSHSRRGTRSSRKGLRRTALESYKSSGTSLVGPARDGADVRRHRATAPRFSRGNSGQTLKVREANASAPTPHWKTASDRPLRRLRDRHAPARSRRKRPATEPSGHATSRRFTKFTARSRRGRRTGWMMKPGRGTRRRGLTRTASRSQRYRRRSSRGHEGPDRGLTRRLNPRAREPEAPGGLRCRTRIIHDHGRVSRRLRAVNFRARSRPVTIAGRAKIGENRPREHEPGLAVVQMISHAQITRDSTATRHCCCVPRPGCRT